MNLHNAIVFVGINFCLADFDGSGTRDVSDIFAFLSTWFSGDPRGNVNGVNGIEVGDIFTLLSAWFAGC